MAANHFKVDGVQIDSLSEFLRRETDDAWRNLLFYPESFESKSRHPIVFTGKEFFEVSFKDTDIKRVRFVRCRFERCLFIGATVTDCEFTDCEFIETNTSKLKIKQCLFDPLSFEKNFDFENDTNIAIDLYHSLYRNASEEHQPIHAIESLYRMKRAEYSHLNSQKQRGIISSREYYSKKIGHIVSDFVSGYGLRTMRVLRLLTIVIGSFSIINYLLRCYIFPPDSEFTIVDSIYFSCITITTLGFGDITPVTAFGKLFVTFQALSGFVVISIFLAAVTNRALRAR